MAKDRFTVSIVGDIEQIQTDPKAVEKLRKEVTNILSKVPLKYDDNTIQEFGKKIGQAISTYGKKGLVRIFDNYKQEVTKIFSYTEKGNISRSKKPIPTDQLYYQKGIDIGILGERHSRLSSVEKGSHYSYIDYSGEELKNRLEKTVKDLKLPFDQFENMLKDLGHYLTSFHVDTTGQRWGGAVNLGGKNFPLSGDIRDGYLTFDRGAGLGWDYLAKSASQAGEQKYFEELKAYREINQELKFYQDNQNKIINAKEKIDKLTQDQANSEKKLSNILKTETMESFQSKHTEDIDKIKDRVAKRREETQAITNSNQAMARAQQLLEEIYRIEAELQGFKYQHVSEKDRIAEEAKLRALREEFNLKKKELTTDQQRLLSQKEELKVNKLESAEIAKQNKLKSSGAVKVNFFDDIQRASQRVLVYGMAYKLQGMLTQQVTRAVQTLVDFDKVMTNIQIITQKSDKEVKSLTQSYIKLAKEVGSTSQAVFESADLWLRQGKTISETNELIQATMIMSNITGINSATVADMLTSALNGFKMAASDAMHVVDVFSAIDLKAATSTQELAEALQRVAATAGEAGISFENVTAYIGTLVDATRLDAGTIGSAKCFWCKI